MTDNDHNDAEWFQFDHRYQKKNPQVESSEQYQVFNNMIEVLRLDLNAHNEYFDKDQIGSRKHKILSVR